MARKKTIATRVKEGTIKSRYYVEDKASFLSEKTKDVIRKYPVESVLIGLAAGILIGVGGRELVRKTERKKSKLFFRDLRRFL